MPPRKPPTRKYTFKVIDVKGDGNCFFRAIYKSAKHSNNLLKLVNCFLDKPFDEYVNNERTFIMDMREKLAKSIEEGNDGGQVEGIFHNLAHFTDDIESYEMIIDSLPKWIGECFPKPPKSLEEFRNEVCKNIRKQGTYVSQIEIDIFQYLNNTFCSEPDKHVILKIFATTPKNNDDVDLSQINILNVANIHYKYLRSYESIDNESKSKSSSAFSSSSSSPPSSPPSSLSPPSPPPTRSSRRVTKSKTKAKEAKPKESIAKPKESIVKAKESIVKAKESKVVPKQSTRVKAKKASPEILSDESSMSDETREIMRGFSEFILENKDKK